nr:collagen alpha-1(X) chain-like [Vulpes vulpes]
MWGHKHPRKTQHPAPPREMWGHKHPRGSQHPAPPGETWGTNIPEGPSTQHPPGRRGGQTSQRSPAPNTPQGDVGASGAGEASQLVVVVPACARELGGKVQRVCEGKAPWPAWFPLQFGFLSPWAVLGSGGEGRDGWGPGKDDRRHLRGPPGSSGWAGFLARVALGTPGRVRGAGAVLGRAPRTQGDFGFFSELPILEGLRGGLGLEMGVFVCPCYFILWWFWLEDVYKKHKRNWRKVRISGGGCVSQAGPRAAGGAAFRAVHPQVTSQRPNPPRGQGALSVRPSPALVQAETQGPPSHPRVSRESCRSGQTDRRRQWAGCPPGSGARPI